MITFLSEETKTYKHQIGNKLLVIKFTITFEAETRTHTLMQTNKYFDLQIMK